MSLSSYERASLEKRLAKIERRLDGPQHQALTLEERANESVQLQREMGKLVRLLAGWTPKSA